MSIYYRVFIESVIDPVLDVRCCPNSGAKADMA